VDTNATQIKNISLEQTPAQGRSTARIATRKSQEGSISCKSYNGRMALMIGALLMLASCGGDDGVEIHTVSGTVAGLSGTGLALHISSGDDLSVSDNGTFTFPKPISRGTSYSVTVKTQPTQPPQDCVVANGEGKIGAANIADIAVTCTLATARFAFISNADALTVSVFSIDSANGSLTPIAGSPFPAVGAQQLFAVAMSPTGKFLAVADGLASTVLIFSIDQNTGALTQVAGSPFATETDAGTSGVTFDKTGSYLYAANYTTSNISAFSVNPDTGALAAIAGSPFAAPDGAETVAIDPSGKFALVAGFNAKAVAVYSVDPDSGALTQVAGSPFSTGAEDFPTDIAFGSNGNFVYTPNIFITPDGSLSAFILDPLSGKLEALAGSPFAIPENGFITADQPGHFLFVTSLHDLSVYSINASSGLLKQIGSSYPLSVDTSDVAVERSGKFLYITDSTDDTITGYAIAADTGALTVIPGMPIPGGLYTYNIVTY
jgi:6-phosphogluconolactonase